MHLTVGDDISIFYSYVYYVVCMWIFSLYLRHGYYFFLSSFLLSVFDFGRFLPGESSGNINNSNFHWVPIFHPASWCSYCCIVHSLCISREIPSIPHICMLSIAICIGLLFCAAAAAAPVLLAENLNNRYYNIISMDVETIHWWL